MAVRSDAKCGACLFCVGRVFVCSARPAVLSNARCRASHASGLLFLAWRTSRNAFANGWFATARIDRIAHHVSHAATEAAKAVSQICNCRRRAAVGTFGAG